MDFQRYLLIAACAALSFMLLTEWVQFNDRKKTDEIAAAYQQQSSNQTAVDIADARAAVVPTTVPAMVNNAGDLPSLQPVANTAIAATPTVNTIRVTTDSLVLDISTSGGDIIYSALPKYFAEIDTPDIPFTLLEQSPVRTYVAQSGLIGSNGIDTSEGRALYSSSASSYRMGDDQDQLIVDLLHTADNGSQVTKRFRFYRGEYLVDVEYLIDNRSSESWTASMFGQIKRDDTDDPSADSSGMGMAPYLGAAIHLADEPYKKISFDDIKEKALEL